MHKTYRHMHTHHLKYQKVYQYQPISYGLKISISSTSYWQYAKYQQYIVDITRYYCIAGTSTSVVCMGYWYQPIFKILIHAHRVMSLYLISYLKTYLDCISVLCVCVHVHTSEIVSLQMFFQERQVICQVHIILLRAKCQTREGKKKNIMISTEINKGGIREKKTHQYQTNNTRNTHYQLCTEWCHFVQSPRQHMENADGTIDTFLYCNI